jgi:hypothetical protein
MSVQRSLQTSVHKWRVMLVRKLSLIERWLDKHKVWFETVAAVSLAGASIYVSYLQFCVSDKQTVIANAEIRLLEREEALSQQKAWSEFRDLHKQMTALFHKLPITPGKRPDDFSECDKMPYQEKCQWLSEISPLWSRLGCNRLVVDNPDLFDLYMKTIDDIEIWGNPNLLHRTEMSQEIVPRMFPTVLKNMSLSLAQMAYVCTSPPLALQTKWHAKTRAEAIRKGFMIVNPDGTTTIPGKAGTL